MVVGIYYIAWLIQSFCCSRLSAAFYFSLLSLSPHIFQSISQVMSTRPCNQSVSGDLAFEGRIRVHSQRRRTLRRSQHILIHILPPLDLCAILLKLPKA
jgi:hypothetical protein